MGMIKKFKLWWKTTSTTEKVMLALGGISTTATVAGMIASIKTKDEVKDVKVEVKLYPGGKDDPNPIELTPEKDTDGLPPITQNPMLREPAESRSQYKQACELYDKLDAIYNQMCDCEVTDEQVDSAREMALELAWDLAEKENRLGEAPDDLPMQAHD